MPQLVAACSCISLPPHTASAVALPRPRPTSLPVDAVHCPPDFPDSVQSRFLNADHSRTARLWAEMLGVWPWKAGQSNSYLSSHVIWLSLSDHWLSVCWLGLLERLGRLGEHVRGVCRLFMPPLSSLSSSLSLHAVVSVNSIQHFFSTCLVRFVSLFWPHLTWYLKIRT